MVFFSNLVSIFSVMRHNSSILFQLKFYILSIKGAYQNTNFTWAVCCLKFSTSVGSFCQNHIKFQLKKYRTVISHDTTEWCKVLRKHWLAVSNDMRIFGEFLPNHIKVWNFHFDGIRFQLKKYTGVIFHDAEQWCKIWINPDLVVSKMAWGIGWTFIRVLKSLKNCPLMGSFCPKHIMFQVKIFRGIMCHDTEEWCKIKKKNDSCLEKRYKGFC